MERRKKAAATGGRTAAWREAGLPEELIEYRTALVERERTKPSEVFALRLRETREARNITQTELARRMSDAGYPMKKKAILEIEKGQRKITLDEALALAWVLPAAPMNLLAPPGDYVFPVESMGLDTHGFNNWINWGDPWLTTAKGKRVRSRMNLFASAENLAQSLLDAHRSNNKELELKSLVALGKLVERHKTEIDAAS